MIPTPEEVIPTHRKGGILGLREPEGMIPTPAVLTDKPEHERKEVPQPN